MTPEDLMEMVVAADAERQRALNGVAFTPVPPWKRAWIEPWFNILGLLAGQLLALLPWPLRWRADARISYLLSRRRTAVSTNFAAMRQETIALTRRLHQETGQWPAALLLTSHPATTGPLEWLRFEVTRQGQLLADAVVETTCAGRLYRIRPECFLAIDPFALDTLPVVVEGLYSGFMHRIYLVWDRQSRTQGWLQRQLLLRRTGYDRIAARLLGRLRRGIPVVMVLPGGLPHNARLFYAAREFVLQLPVLHWPYAKRTAQQKWMEVLMRPVNGTRPCEQGQLPPETRAALRSLLSQWGLADSIQDRWLDRFAQEFALEVPYRARFFRVLMRRLVARGQPLLWTAVAHRLHPPYVQVSPPWGAYRDGQGRLQLLRSSQAPPEAISDITELAKTFSAQFRT